MKGRRPTTPEQRRLRGEVRRGRDTPVLIAGRRSPIMPRGLLPRQQTLWRNIVRDLAGAGVLDAADGHVVYCLVVQVWLAEEAMATLRLSELGILNVNSQGLVAHPAVAILDRATKEIRQLTEELPLSPWGRARLNLHGTAAGGLTIEDELGPARPPLRAVPG